MFSLSQDEGNPFGVTSRTIDSLGGRGFETTISRHKDLGELGIDKLEDILNTARLKMAEQFLHEHEHRMSYII